MSNQRRNFLKSLSLSSLGVLVPSLATNASPKTINECLVTTPDVEGPFFKTGAPIKVKIADAAEPGDRLSIKGKVFGQDCSTPLQNAVIDVWQASAKGIYDTSSTYKLRGKVVTDGMGLYEFETVYPGSYDGRPSHIHLKISAQGFRTLTTQLYFQGDPLLATDPFASRPGAGPRIISLEKKEADLYGVFDIYLASTATATSTPVEKGYIAQAGPNPFTESTSIIFSNYENAEVDITIYDISGKVVKELIHQEMAKGKYTLVWDGLDEHKNPAASGLYICKMEIDHEPLKEIRLIRK